MKKIRLLGSRPNQVGTLKTQARLKNRIWVEKVGSQSGFCFPSDLPVSEVNCFSGSLSVPA